MPTRSPSPPRSPSAPISAEDVIEPTVEPTRRTLERAESSAAVPVPEEPSRVLQPSRKAVSFRVPKTKAEPARAPSAMNVRSILSPDKQTIKIYV